MDLASLEISLDMAFSHGAALKMRAEQAGRITNIPADHGVKDRLDELNDRLNGLDDRLNEHQLTTQQQQGQITHQLGQITQ
ncbi:MAG: hypothetical protein M1839_001972 [Geoglossum umbratile]|nr:MAG: hypothetical protein M1839_001972 [Geoglossum umbratile]